MCTWSSLFVSSHVGRSGGQVQRPIQGKIVVRRWDHYGALLSDRLPLPAERRKALDRCLVSGKHRGVRASPRNRLDNRIETLSVSLWTGGGQLPPGTRPAIIESIQGLAHRFRVDVHVELSIEVFRNSAGCLSSRIFSLLRWVPLYEPLNFLLDLLVDFWGTTLAVSIVQTGRSFLIETIHPLINHRAGDVVNLGNLGSRIATAA